MAGLITHFLLCSKAMFDMNLNKDLKRVIAANADWTYLGAGSPDLPYAMLIGDQSGWSDAMHYRLTNGIPKLGQEVIKRKWGTLDRLTRVRLSWLAGYISHLVADATIHPVVEAIVGPYSDEANQSSHRLCEKIQDSLLFYELTEGQDITYAEYSDRFDNCKSSNYYEEMMSFWKQLLVTVYKEDVEQGKLPRPEPKQWFTFFRDGFDTMDNAGGIVAVFRHAGIGALDTILYSSQRDLRLKHMDDCRTFYDQVKLPGGSFNSFLDVYNITMQNIVIAWNKLYEGVLESSMIAEVVKDWNLDTGRVMDDTSELTYWKV